MYFIIIFFIIKVKFFTLTISVQAFLIFTDNPQPFKYSTELWTASPSTFIDYNFIFNFFLVYNI